MIGERKMLMDSAVQRKTTWRPRNIQENWKQFGKLQKDCLYREVEARSSLVVKVLCYKQKANFLQFT
jgi:hypothetical protein